LVNIYNLFLEQTKDNEENIAIIYDGTEYSYAYLLEEIKNISEKLQINGLIEGEVVALYMTCSFLSVASLLAIWKLGAAVLPFDENTPKIRCQNYLEQSKAKMILTEKDKLLNIQVCNVNESLKNENIAYIMFTSGSTGNPKGVKISGKNIESLIAAWQEFYGLLDFLPRVLQLSSISTDMFIGNLLKSLFFSGTLIIVNKEDRLNLASMVQVFDKYKPNLIEFIPSYMRLVLEQVIENSLGTTFLKQIVVGGEACSQLDYKWMIANFPLARVVNGYGLTECTIESVVYETKNMDDRIDEQRMLIGKPLNNTHVFVVNSNLELISDGECGELLIGGDGVAEGYLDEAMDKGKFIRFKGINCYRTGDTVQKMSSGDLLFLGRNDEQIQVNGYRVELSEINGVLGEISGVKEAVALNVGKDSFKPQVVAFVVATLDKKSILAEIILKLPEQMVPTEIILLDSLPRTVSGKIDRQALISSLKTKMHEEKENYQPKNVIIAILGEVLEKPLFMDRSIGAQGADSLAMIRILHKLKQQEFNAKISDIYATNSINSFIDLMILSKEQEPLIQYSCKRELISAELIKTKLGELRQSEIVFFNKLILSGVEKILDLESFKASFRTIQREKYNIDYLLFNDKSFNELAEKHFCLLKEQDLLRSTLNVEDKLAWLVFKLPEDILPILVDLSDYHFEQSQILSMLPFIKEYYLIKDKLSRFPYRHLFVKISDNKFMFVFCMDESIHNKVGADIVKSYFSLGKLDNTVQYEEYLKLLKKGSLLSEEDIVKEFRLKEFNNAVESFPEYSLEQIRLYNYEFVLDKQKDSYTQSLEIFKKISNNLFELDVPFFMVQDTRAYQDGIFSKTIGEFTDFIPCVLSLGGTFEKLINDINFLRKKATLTFTNMKSFKWFSVRYTHPIIKKFASNVKLEREGMEKIVVFHYRTEVDDSTELYSTENIKQNMHSSWPTAITFNFAQSGDKLFLSSYLPCDKNRWLEIVREIEDGKI